MGRGDILKRFLIHTNSKKASLDKKEEIERLLEENGFDIVEDNPDLIIVIGGDGTMLSAIRKYKELQVPYVGVNTGTLGFLPSIPPNNVGLLIDIIQTEDYFLQSYPLLAVKCRSIHGEEIVNHAFNEVLIKHVDPRLMEAKIYINSKPFNYFTGDGLIVSTPIGTTGYAIWAGGAAIQSELSCFQITPMNANDNSINSPLKNSLVMSGDTKLDIEIIKGKSRAVTVACDGRNVSDEFIEEIHVKISKMSVKILRWGDYNYFDLYRNKIIDKNVCKVF
jgi:NAD+ kinase